MSAARRTSAIWQYFQEVREDKKSNWVCVICKTVGSCKNTSNQWRHLELHHKEVWEELKGKKQPPKRRRREDDDDSHHLLDNDSGRMEDDTDAIPSTSASAAPNAGPSTTTSASTAANAGPSTTTSATAASESERSSSQSAGRADGFIYGYGLWTWRDSLQVFITHALSASENGEK